MISWKIMGRRWAAAWAALGGSLDGDEELMASERAASGSPKMGRAPNPAAWRRKVRDWSSRRANASAADATFLEGRALMGMLASMDPAAKKAVVKDESESIFSIGEELLEAASRSCDMVDPEWAREQTELHAMFCAALGEPASAKALREAASRTSRCAWWEVANEWGMALGAQARMAEQNGAPAWGDEEAQSMCEMLSICASKALLGCLGGSGLDTRDRAVWSQCGKWPWPARALAPGSVEWARRKWRDSLYSGREEVDAAFAALPTGATWGDLAMARSGMESPSPWMPKPESIEMVLEMRAMFRAERERDAMEKSAFRPGKAMSRGLSSKAL